MREHWVLPDKFNKGIEQESWGYAQVRDYRDVIWELSWETREERTREHGKKFQRANKQANTTETAMHRCFWWDSNNFGGELLVWVYRRVAGGLKVGGWSSYWEGQSLGHEWSWRNTPHFVGSERFNNMKRLGVAWIIHMDAEVVKNKDKNSEANYSSEDG